MKKTLLFTVAACAILCIASCSKPSSDNPSPTPGPDPTTTEITSNNAAPGGFTDGGAEDWD